MTRIITDIRPVGIAPHLTLIADVKEDGCLLGYSVTIDQLTSDELTAYAVIEAAELEQERHKALQIVLDVTAPKSDVDKWLDNLTPAELDFVNWVTSNESDDADWMQQTNELRNG